MEIPLKIHGNSMEIPRKIHGNPSDNKLKFGQSEAVQTSVDKSDDDLLPI
jgi:hypothetical protein